MYIEAVGSGPDVVLVHGWAMHSGIFATLTAALADRYTLHLIDLPGHGRSPERDGRLDLRETALRITLSTPPAVWIGWSLGGLVCLEAALSPAAHVRGLGLIATSPRFVHARDWPHGVEHAVFEQFGRDLATDYTGTLERFLALECIGSDCARAELRELRARAFEHGEPALHVLEDGLRILADTDLRGDLVELRTPTTWIAGARDRLVPSAACEWSAQRMPHARLVNVAGGGHAPFIGHPQAVLQEIETLLGEVYH